tara:strand:+ start:586 stop:696 length:111 start_codon:yes stop_codon:yes gene_type:complete
MPSLDGNVYIVSTADNKVFRRGSEKRKKNDKWNEEK